MIKTIQIGPVTYTVTEEKNLIDITGQGQHSELLGHIIHHKALLKIEAENDPAIKKATVWHEIVHGIFEQAGIRDQDGLEGAVIALGYGLVDVIRNNPELVDWTQEADHA